MSFEASSFDSSAHAVAADNGVGLFTSSASLCRWRLTTRETEVMSYVAAGLNDRQIAAAMHLTTDTVKYHLKNVYQKLGVNNRTRAAVSLVMMGLVPAASVDGEHS